LLEGALVGFLAVLFSGEEVEILNVAVAIGARRKGIASQLLERVLEVSSISGAQRAWLEVRASNVGAVTFYERNRFHEAGRRKNYYSSPREDAIVLTHDLSTSR
jgi:ribosomal-protein-alanine N-acetyltransferase